MRGEVFRLNAARGTGVTSSPVPDTPSSSSRISCRVYLAGCASVQIGSCRQLPA